MAELENVLAWSHSRARAFEGCKRAYYFAYYGSWGGWKDGAPSQRRDAWIQKKLTSRAMWVGSSLHGVAQGVLVAVAEGRPPPSVDEARDAATLQAERDIRGSEDGTWLRRPARNVGFREHYYHETVPQEAWDEAVAEIGRQVDALFGRREFQRLLAVGSRIREVERLASFKLGDVPVWVALDVMVDDGRGGVVILDWKTGDRHDDEVIAAQLGVYGLYAVREHGVPRERVVAMHVNLRHGTSTRHAVGPAEMSAAEEEIQASMARMRAALVDPAANVARVEDFPTLDEGDPACGRCAFRGVCGRR